MIRHALAIANGKGGVGKTSIAANLAGELARSGVRTLTIDLDPQGNLGSDIGYRSDPLADEGRSLAAATLHGQRVTIIEQVRPNLDAIPGGHELQELADQLTFMRLTEPDRANPLSALLTDVAHGYDAVIVDCPPTGGSIVDGTIDAVGNVLVPVRADDASLDGLEMIARSFARARSGTNPDITLLGVVVFDSAVNAKAIRSDLRRIIEEDLGGIAPMFQTFIRRSERSAYDMRRFGLLANEYADKADELLTSMTVRARIEASRRGEAAARFSSASRGLADDYQNLAQEVTRAWHQVAV